MAANYNSNSSSNKKKAPNTKPYTWNELEFSESSNQLLREISNYQEGVDLIDLLKMLNKNHPEYGSVSAAIGSRAVGSAPEPFKKFILYLEQKDKLLNLSKFTSNQWAEEVLSIFTIPEDPPIINGRLFLTASLLFQFKDIFTQLNRASEWTESCAELIDKLDNELDSNAKITYRSLLTPKGRALIAFLDNLSNRESKDIFNESIIDTSNLSDGPAIVDSLSRTALAKYLAKRLRHIYSRDIDKGKFGSFFMHIDGAWGSGKSTLLGFLEKELKTDAPDRKKDKQKSEGKWLVVNFNAWENQRLDPPWWFLMKTVYREAMKSLKGASDNKATKSDKKKRRGLFMNELKWRLTTGSNYLLVIVITLLLILFSLYSGVVSEAEFSSLPLIKLVTFIGFLWSLAKLFGTSLASGSAKAAQTFIDENSKDPMQVLAGHFNDQISKIDYPVAIFIDDLDRCNRDYGIKLLEGLQTIFKRAGVVYVIAADRKWLSTMYESQYEMFASIIERPAKPFGLVFLDKIFQLIVELPDISSVQKKIYWDNLLRGNSPDEREISEDDRSAIKEEIAAARSNSRKMDVAYQQSSSPQKEQLAREEVLGSLSIGEEENVLENKLLDFVDLIEPNPRSMKRLINDISTARAIAFLYKQEVEEDELILWTILKLQHPLLAEFFWLNPQKLDEVSGYSDINSNFTTNKKHDQLILDPEVKKLFHYSLDRKIVSLDSEFIHKLKFQVD